MKSDFVDKTLLVGFLITLITICYMTATNQAIPNILETIFWALAVGFGLKKTPTNL